jgi:hypothetical protein
VRELLAHESVNTNQHRASMRSVDKTLTIKFKRYLLMLINIGNRHPVLNIEECANDAVSAKIIWIPSSNDQELNQNTSSIIRPPNHRGPINIHQ